MRLAQSRQLRRVMASSSRPTEAPATAPARCPRLVPGVLRAGEIDYQKGAEHDRQRSAQHRRPRRSTTRRQPRAKPQNRGRDPRGSRNKYEFDPALGAIRLDRFISASIVDPTDYGFVPETIAPDGDPLDVLLCVSEPTFPGCVVNARPVALLSFDDEKGQDDHIVCVPCDDPNWANVREATDLTSQLRAEIGHFFSI